MNLLSTLDLPVRNRLQLGNLRVPRRQDDSANNGDQTGSGYADATKTQL